MAIDTKTLYDFVQFAANKEQAGFITASEFEQALDSAQLELIKDRYNNPNTYQPGRPVSRVGYGQSGKVDDDLRLVTKESSLAFGTYNNGLKYDLPSDYLHFVSAQRGHPQTQNIKKVSIERFNYRKNSMLFSANLTYGGTMDFGVCCVVNSTLRVFPANPTNATVEFTYIKRPTKGTLTETINVTTGSITVATNQTISDMPEQVFNELAWRILSIFGINIREQALMQYAEMQEKE